MTAILAVQLGFPVKAATEEAAQTDAERKFLEGAQEFGQEHMWKKEFTPDKVPGLRLWLRADTGVIKDEQGRVSAWSDPERGVTLKQANPALHPVFFPAAQNRNPALATTVKTAPGQQHTLTRRWRTAESIEN